MSRSLDMGYSMPFLLPMAFCLWWPWSMMPTRSLWVTHGTSKMRCACLSNQYMTGILVHVSKIMLMPVLQYFPSYKFPRASETYHYKWIDSTGHIMTFQNSAGEKSEIDSTGFELKLLRGLPFLCGLLRWGHLFLSLVAASIFSYISVFLRNRTYMIYLYIILICVCISIFPFIHSFIYQSGIGSRSHRGCCVKCPTVSKLE